MPTMREFFAKGGLLAAALWNLCRTLGLWRGERQSSSRNETGTTLPVVHQPLVLGRMVTPKNN